MKGLPPGERRWLASSSTLSRVAPHAPLLRSFFRPGASPTRRKIFALTPKHSACSPRNCTARRRPPSWWEIRPSPVLIRNDMKPLSRTRVPEGGLPRYTEEMKHEEEACNVRNCRSAHRACRLGGRSVENQDF